VSISQTTPSAELKRIIESANRLGIELDEAEALQWLTAMAVEEAGDDIVFNEREGVFGHRVSMLDFSPEDLDHFRKIGQLNPKSKPIQVMLIISSGLISSPKVKKSPAGFWET
jgi:hypothetical protein